MQFVAKAEQVEVIRDAIGRTSNDDVGDCAVQGLLNK
jgi:hypothetical protein